MKIVFFVADMRSASSRLRALQYAPLLEEEGFDVRICATRPSRSLPRPAWCPRWCRLLYCAAGLVLIVVQRVWQLCTVVPGSSVVFLQKDLFFRSRSALPERLLGLLARRLVFDVDDAIYLGTSYRRTPGMRAKIAAIARASTVVLAGSGPIAAELRPHAAELHVARTCTMLAPSARRTYERRGDVLRLVWTGTATNARHLDLVALALRRLGRVQLELVTRVAELPSGLLSGLDVELTEWSPAAEAAALARADAALAPLADDEWTRAKCGARVLACFAAAIPVVASPVGAQQELVIHETTGLIASGSDEWLACLLALRNSEELRARLGRAGRACAEWQYDARRQYPQWREWVVGER
jgi:glycosyltransferase involved in cell wall biosynthesis